jgi:multisubunit Na+/H+ antiporter MnhB subunit
MRFMSFLALRPLTAPLAPRASFGASAALLGSVGVGICAAAPEFIWQGLLVALHHAGWADFLSVLLISLNVAFFIEPAMERLRVVLDRTERWNGLKNTRRTLLFTVILSLVFSVTSVCLHEAMLAFISEHGAEWTSPIPALNAGIALIAAWAIVPFAVTLAWESAGCRWLAVPMGIIAALSPSIAGWLFSWPTKSVIVTSIPVLFILAMGYRRIRQKSELRGLTSLARIVATVAMIWLGIMPLLDAVLTATGLDHFKPYTSADLFIDARFYFGWVIGLMLAPAPHRAANPPRQ